MEDAMLFLVFALVGYVISGVVSPLFRGRSRKRQ